MQFLSNLWAAIGRLTGNINALADTVGETNAQLRARLALDPPETPALEDAAASNGRKRGKVSVE